MRSSLCPAGPVVYRFTIRPAAGWSFLPPSWVLLLALVTNAPAQASVNVTPNVSVSPSSIDFGDQIVNGPGANSQVQIRNLGPGPVLISSIQITGANVDDFRALPDMMFPCVGTLAPGTSCSADIIFTPTQLGPRSAMLVVTAESPLMVSLSGTGTTGAPLPKITCPPSVLATAAAGQTSAAVSIGMATATGDGVTVTARRGDGGALGAPYPIGVTIITWTATDPSLDTATCTQSVTIQAVSQSLLISCPPNQAVVVNGTAMSVPVAPGLATSTNAGAAIVGVRSDGKALTDLYPIGTTTITWTATDASGDEGTCAQTITVGSGSIAPGSTGGFVDPSDANPHLDGLTPPQGPLYQTAILHGSGFADFQGSSYVRIGGRRVTALAWSANAINILVNPLAFDPAPLAIDATYPVQVITPDSGGESNQASFFLTDGAPAGHSGSGGATHAGPPHFGSFQQALFCPGDTVVFLGAGFGSAQGSGYLAVTVPLADPSGNVVHQLFVLPVISWQDTAISFALNLPAGAIPGPYLTTVHRSDGKTTSGAFAVGTRNSNGNCTAQD